MWKRLHFLDWKKIYNCSKRHRRFEVVKWIVFTALIIFLHLCWTTPECSGIIVESPSHCYHTVRGPISAVFSQSTSERPCPDTTRPPANTIIIIIILCSCQSTQSPTITSINYIISTRTTTTTPLCYFLLFILLLPLTVSLQHREASAAVQHLSSVAEVEWNNRRTHWLRCIPQLNVRPLEIATATNAADVVGRQRASGFATAASCEVSTCGQSRWYWWLSSSWSCSCWRLKQQL